MSGMGVSEGIETLGVAIQNNPRIPLTFLDLSLNKITDKAIETGLSRGIASLSMGLRSKFYLLSITENKKNRNLRYLNLSNNSFGKQGSEAFAQWLETTHNDNVLTLLNLSNCALDVGIVALAIAKYQSAHTLKAVDFSGNKFDKRAYIHVATMMKESKTLKELNISNTLPTSDGCAAILNEILANSTLSNIVLSISANDIGAQGAKILSSTFQKNENSQVLEEIIIDDNNLKAEGVNDILNALTKIQSLKRISISRNVPKAKNSINLVFPFAQIMQKQSLEYLRVCGDSKFYLGSSLEQFFKNTTGKSNLRAIDITGNQAGDSALRALALHAAHPNSKLVLINFDLNKTTIANFSEFARIFESNSNLSFLAWPKFDAQSILKDAPKRNTLELQSKLKQFKSLFYEGNKKNNLKLPVISVDLKRFENQDPFLIHSHDFFRCQLESDDDPNNSNSQVVQSSLSLLSNKKM
ncbi:ynein regulatory complex subunit 5 [Anaeramoeba ignava]|uniref:Ynein regulatory complex subunit 5 n=1 Tax=Anaeramoeba ignava TaxID=1746090 RepID=A0A9Q0RH66_ANAIG|nr:ynein regulatory complex subunit 5 [Anaeramoeba ignava]